MSRVAEFIDSPDRIKFENNCREYNQLIKRLESSEERSEINDIELLATICVLIRKISSSQYVSSLDLPSLQNKYQSLEKKLNGRSMLSSLNRQ